MTISSDADPTLYYRRGAECLARGDAAGAARELERAIEIAPNYAWAHQNLGQAYRALGDLVGAEKALRRAIKIDPNYLAALTNLGSLLAEFRRYSEAVEALSRARQLAPNNAVVRQNHLAALKLLGDSFAREGENGSAFAVYRLLLRENPDDRDCLDRLASMLSGVVFEAADEDLFADLLRIVDSPMADPRRISSAIVSALRHHPEIQRIATRPIDSMSAERLAGIPILLRLMEVATVPDLEIEKLLTAARQRALKEIETLPAGALPLLVALSRLCFINEYVFAETAEETGLVRKLADRVSAQVAAGRQPAPGRVAVLAAYRPLGAFPWAAKLRDLEWPHVVEAVLAQQIFEPQEEFRLRAEIPRLTAIDDATSKAVGAQYEGNPYPRWTRIAIPRQPLSLKHHCQLWCPHQSFSGFPDDPDVLIAGCGTGRQPLYGAAWYAVKSMLAIDLSQSSLAYALRKARELGITAVEFGQADLLKVPDLGRSFDFIESIGVLHHLADPSAGLRALAGVLRSHGIMRLGLYGERDRAGWLDKVHGLLREHGLQLPTDSEAVRHARQLIIQRAIADPDLQTLVRFDDFFGLSECRDLAFHVQEHRFDVAEIQKLLQNCGLHFVGFEEPVNIRATRMFRTLHGEKAPLDALDLWRVVEECGQRIEFRFLCRKIY